MLAQHLTAQINDIARIDRAGADFSYHRGVISIWNETDILAVGFGGDGQIEPFGVRAHLVLGHPAERKTQKIRLLLRRRKQEIALVAGWIDGATKLDALSADTLDVMTGSQSVALQILRRFQKVAELTGLVASPAPASRHARRNRQTHRSSSRNGIRSLAHVRNADGLGDPLIENILPGAASSLAYRFAVVVKLQRDTDDVVAFLREQRRRHGTIDATRHRDDDTGVRRVFGKAEEFMRNMGFWKSRQLPLSGSDPNRRVVERRPLGLCRIGTGQQVDPLPFQRRLGQTLTIATPCSTPSKAPLAIPIAAVVANPHPVTVTDAQIQQRLG